MKPEQKIKILALSLGALVILILSAMATIVYGIQEEKNREEEIYLEMNSVMMSGIQLKQALNLSQGQMNEFRMINQCFRKSARDINRSLDIIRMETFNELQKEDTDTLKCNQFSAEIGNLHKELKLATCRFYLDLKNICEPEQDEKLQEIFEPVFKTSVCMGYGRGGNRFGRGRLINNTK